MTAKGEPEGKEHRDYWSECGQVFFTGGKGYGVMDTLATICLGSEEDINRYLDAGDNADKFSTPQLEVLEQIRIYREEEGIGNIGAKSMERAGTYGITGRKQKTTGHTKAGKRAVIRQARQKRPMLSR